MKTPIERQWWQLSAGGVWEAFGHFLICTLRDAMAYFGFGLILLIVTWKKHRGVWNIAKKVGG